MGPGGTGVEHRGNAFGNAVRVGRNSERRHAVVNVHVDVNQSRRDDFATGIEHLPSLGFRNVFRDVCDSAARDCNVPLA